MTTNGIGAVTDMDLLLQKIVKFLLTAQGTNIADVNYGTYLGDKAYLARMGNDLSAIKLLVANAIDSANTYFAGSPTGLPNKNFDHITVQNVYVSNSDPTVFFAETLVYLTDGTIYSLTVNP